MTVNTQEDAPIRENLATELITWDEVSQYINSKELYKLRRSKEETVKYHEHKDHLKAQNTTVLQYILDKLKWNEQELNELNDKKFPTDKDKTNTIFTQHDLYKVTLNDFPYHYESNIIHVLIWSKLRLPIYLNDTTDIDMFEHEANHYPDMNPITKEKIDKFLEQTLATKFNLMKGRDYLWFVNYSNLQSIKAVSHIHLLLRLKDKDSAQKMGQALLQENVLKPL